MSTPIRIGEVEHLQAQLTDVRQGIERAKMMADALSTQIEGAMLRHRVHAIPPARFIQDTTGAVFACEDAG